MSTYAHKQLRNVNKKHRIYVLKLCMLEQVWTLRIKKDIRNCQAVSVFRTESASMFKETYGNYSVAPLLFHRIHLSSVWLLPWTSSTETFSPFQVVYCVSLFFFSSSAGGIQMWSVAPEPDKHELWEEQRNTNNWRVCSGKIDKHNGRA